MESQVTSLELKGKIIAVMEPRSGVGQGGRRWMAQEFVLETAERYPQRVCFSLRGEDAIGKAAIREGFPYRVTFSVDAREYNGRWINEVRAYRVEPLDNTLFGE